MANQFTYQNQKFSVGDTINVHQSVQEADKTRTQIFQGVIIAIRGSGVNQSFTVRKIAVGNIGVERIFPVNTPTILKLDKEKSGHVRRAKLYYLRQRTGKQAIKIKDKGKVSSQKTSKSAHANKTSRPKSRRHSQKTPSQ